jgi:hypothetical protein
MILRASNQEKMKSIHLQFAMAWFPLFGFYKGASLKMHAPYAIDQRC